MLARAALVLPFVAVACAHSPETVVHFSAADRAAWEARDAEGNELCSLPCTVELDARDTVTVVRSDGATQFVVHQENLGPGAFSGLVRVRRDRTRGSLAAQVLSGALVGAGTVLQSSDDDDHVAAGILLSGLGAAALAASDAARPRREELWVERTSTP